MDISIPVIDGWEATQVLKHDPQTRQIPIIALTAHALASDREKAMEVGCDGYLAKPCEPRAVRKLTCTVPGSRDGRISHVPVRSWAVAVADAAGLSCSLASSTGTSAARTA